SSAPGKGVVWEWENDSGSWTPYDMDVGITIQRVGVVSLPAHRWVRVPGSDSSSHPPSGTIRPVRRSYYDPSSAPGKGVVWEWENDSGSWTPYDMDVGITIQRAYEKQHPWVDLSAIGFCYVIDFATMGSSKVSRPSLGTLNRSHLQRLAIAQSRVLIASGVPTVPVKNLTGSSPVNPALAGITGILMSAAGLPVCLTRPPKLVLHPPPVSKSEIQSIPGISHTCRKTTKKQAKKGKTPEEVLKKYLQKVRHPPDEDCTICMERLSAPSGYKGPQPAVKPDLVGKLVKCGHVFHLHCLVAMYNNGNKDGSLQCPTCKTIYGVKTGTQPPGKMEYHIIPHALPGHSDCKTIRIIYNIPPGVQGPEHPNPGKSFTARGFPRHCYLPDSEKGRKVLKLLLVAWDRRLIFAIGTSSTTGESDTVIWNEIHHKTEFGSNLTGHGYPDINYLDNVLAELAAQGITEESLVQEKD
uniref:E3 ubiquitin-protein ligase n=1 Tax=Bubo bubo TaxID=30461 RepID=A0A8C0EIP0_BUBBB